MSAHASYSIPAAIRTVIKGHHAIDSGAVLSAVNASVLRTDRGMHTRGFGH